MKPAWTLMSPSPVVNPELSQTMQETPGLGTQASYGPARRRETVTHVTHTLFGQGSASSSERNSPDAPTDQLWNKMGDGIAVAEATPLREWNGEEPESQQSNNSFITPKQKTNRPVSPTYSADSSNRTIGQAITVSPTQEYVPTSPRDARKRKGDELYDSGIGPPHERVNDLPTLDQIKEDPERTLKLAQLS